MYIIPIQGLNAIAWTLCSVAIVVTAGRYWIRYHRLGKLQWDDHLNGLALLLLIGFVATYQAYLPIQYDLELAALGLSDDVPSRDQQVMLLKIQLANELIFWFCIYAVKYSFLATYWAIFNVSAAFRRAWFALTAYTTLSLLLILPANGWQCGNPADYANPDNCEPSQQQVISMITYWCVLNVVGDLLVIALPIVMLRKLTMDRSDKLGLAGLFALVMVIIVFEILRSYYTIDAQASSFPDANAVWALCEPTIAVIVCALPSYRTILPSKRRRAERSYMELLRESEMNSKRSKASASKSNTLHGRTEHSSVSENWEMEPMPGADGHERV